MNDWLRLSVAENNIFGEVWSGMSDEASLNNSTHKNWKEAQDKMHDDPNQVANLKKKIERWLPGRFYRKFQTWVVNC